MSGEFTQNDGRPERYSYTRIYKSERDIIYRTGASGTYETEHFAYGLLVTRQAVRNKSRNVPMRFEVTYSPKPEAIMENLSEEPQAITRQVVVDGKLEFPQRLAVKLLRREPLFIGACHYETQVVQIGPEGAFALSETWTRFWYSSKLRMILKKEAKKTLRDITVVSRHVPDAISVTVAK